MKESDIKLIDKYLNSSLNEEEASLFDQRKKDTDFLEELSFYQDIQSVTTKLGREELKHKLQNLERRPSAESKPKLRVLNRKWLSIAAAGLLVITAGVSWLIQSQYNTDTLLDTFYETPNFSSSRSEGQTSKFNIAADAFYKEDYTKAIASLEQLIVADPHELEVDQLLAHAYFRNNQYNEALELIASSKTNKRYTPEWQWLEVMIYLKMEKDEHALEKLNVIIAQNNHPYRIEALGLREKISHFWRRIF